VPAILVCGPPPLLTGVSADQLASTSSKSLQSVLCSGPSRALPIAQNLMKLGSFESY